MNSMKIGTYQMDTTFGLYLPEYTIPAPAVQTNFVKIIGRDGSVDLSNALGLHYDSRTWSLDFKCFDPTVNWHTLSSQVMNAIHGKRLNFEFDDDPNYFWTGRVSVQNYVSNHGTGTLKVTIVSDPFKYAKLYTIVTKTASTGTEYTGELVTFNTANAKINDLSVTIQPIQDLHGYSNPWPAGGGVNKFDISLYNLSSPWTNVSGVITNVDAPMSSSYNGCGFNGRGTTTLLAGTYTLSLKARLVSGEYTAGKFNALRLHTNGANTKDFQKVSNPMISNEFQLYYGTLTLEESYTFEDINLQFSTGLSNAVFEIKEVQLEHGTTPTSYAPYSNICPITGRTGLSVYVGPTQDVADATTYAFDWTTEAGTVYGGTLDVVTGVLTVDRKAEELSSLSSIDGQTASWTYDSNNNIFQTNRSVVPSGTANADTGIIVECYKSNQYGYNSSYIGQTCLWAHTSGSLRIRDERYTDVSSLMADVGTKKICYPLATPLTYQLTAQEVEALVGTNNVWSDGENVTVAVVTPETLTNNGRAVVPTLTASADMVLKWGNYSASVQQGTSAIPQLILENGANLIYIIGTGSISFTWQEASL